MSEPNSKQCGAEFLLEVQDLCRVYPDGNVAALDHVTLKVRRGEYLAIVGPSGSGKSTLLNIMGTLDAPTHGQVCFAGQPLAGIRNLDALRARKIGFIFQAFHLLPTLTVIENVQVPMFEGPVRSAREREAKARELLATVGLSGRATHVPARLSVGERQRVAIARALANDPQLLLADEPTGNLDSHSGAEILDLFDRLHRERHMTLVVITHSREVAPRAERIIAIRDGHIVPSDEFHWQQAAV